ncbi:MAG: phosphotransferase family protein [bacterium]
MMPEEFYENIKALLVRAGFSGFFDMQQMEGGGNNRIFRIDVNGSRLCLKAYFQDPDDSRDRLSTEFFFTSFLWQEGCRVVPEPFIFDDSHFLALYEFIEGGKVAPHGVNRNYYNQALAFFLYLNGLKEKEAAQALPTASEACFSINEHILCVDRRMKRLQEITGDDDITSEAMHFIQRELSPAWVSIKNACIKEAEASGLNPDHCIVPEDRCLSPSDFGFHNAIVAREGALRFIDFEYAGWDDPAKLVCDFFCQPAMPVPLQFFSPFQEAVANLSTDPARFKQRVQLLFPLYQLKWCCIILNDFLPGGNKRRTFATKTEDKERRSSQLGKARSYFSHFFNNV